MTANDPLRLYLHMGMGKTGSSALQIGFLRNPDALASANVVYPSSKRALEAANRDAVSSGNGGGLRRLLLGGPDENRKAWNDLRKRIEGVPHHLLFSSEILFMAREKNLLRLARLLDELGRTLWPVLYLRNIAGHAVSSYGQRIKRSGAINPLLAYCETKYQPNYQSTLQKLMAVVPASAISVVHYDSHKDNLFEDFLHEVIGAPNETRVTDPVLRTINRSLSSGELGILRRINKVLRPDDGPRAISDALLKDFPDVPTQPSIPRRVNDILHERFSDEVDWINQHFFDTPQLAVASDELNVSEDITDIEEIESARRVLLGVVAAVTKEHDAQQ